MIENFITNIFVENSRNIKNLEIPLSKEYRQHLLLTGKNGSGKTSLLLEINKFLTQIENGNIQQDSLYKNSKEYYEKELLNPNIDSTSKSNLKKQLIAIKNWFERFGGTKIEFSNETNAIVEKYLKGEFLIAFFNSKRHIDLKIPTGINKVDLRLKYGIHDNVSSNFIQYIVNLKADRSFARDDNNIVEAEKIDKWFEEFENRLKQIFDAKNLELRFDRNTYNFDIIVDNKETFNFNNLSDGYSAIISIVAELLLRMEAHQTKVYDLEGIVIIDEIETHLHVDLQKKILPFLTDFFPKIQFIITTHSPFVLSSLSNATICDLETRTVTTDLSSYSYDALLESYFETDKYSDIVKKKIIEFEQLTSIKDKSLEDLDRIRILRDYFVHAPKFLSTELLVKLQQIELNELNNVK